MAATGTSTQGIRCVIMTEPTDYLNECRRELASANKQLQIKGSTISSLIEQLKAKKAELERIKRACPHPDEFHTVRVADPRNDLHDYIEIHYCGLCDQKWEE